MQSGRSNLPVVVPIWAALVVSACQDNTQSPLGRPEVPTEDSPEASNLAPQDLIYVCGNKFLVTNSTRHQRERCTNTPGDAGRGPLVQ
jgi:hypothetical protein